MDSVDHLNWFDSYLNWISFSVTFIIQGLSVYVDIRSIQIDISLQHFYSKTVEKVTFKVEVSIGYKCTEW